MQHTTVSVLPMTGRVCRSGNIDGSNRTRRDREMEKRTNKDTNGQSARAGFRPSLRCRGTMLATIAVVLLLLSSLGLRGGAGWSASGGEVSGGPTAEAGKATFGKLPLAFEPNE